MARLRRRKPEGPTDADRAAALDRARTFYWYGLVAEVEPPFTREEIEAMSPAELRTALDAHPTPPTEATVRESLAEAEGGPLAIGFGE